VSEVSLAENLLTTGQSHQQCGVCTELYHLMNYSVASDNCYAPAALYVVTRLRDCWEWRWNVRSWWEQLSALVGKWSTSLY